jgi:hypothetical protein
VFSSQLRSEIERDATLPPSRIGEQHLFFHRDVAKEVVPKATVRARVDCIAACGGLEQPVEPRMIRGHETFDGTDRADERLGHVPEWWQYPCPRVERLGATSGSTAMQKMRLAQG